MKKYEEMTTEEIAEVTNKGSFEERVELEKQAQDRTRPFLIWKKLENLPTAQDKRSKPREHVYVQHLDHCHSTLDQVMRNAIDFRMQLVFSHIPITKDAEAEERYEPIRRYAEGREREKELIRAEVMKEYGINEKVLAKIKAQQDKETKDQSKEQENAK